MSGFLERILKARDESLAAKKRIEEEQAEPERIKQGRESVDTDSILELSGAQVLLKEIKDNLLRKGAVLKIKPMRSIDEEVSLGWGERVREHSHYASTVELRWESTKSFPEIKPISILGIEIGDTRTRTPAIAKIIVEARRYPSKVTLEIHGSADKGTRVTDKNKWVAGRSVVVGEVDFKDSGKDLKRTVEDALVDVVGKMAGYFPKEKTKENTGRRLR